MIVTKTPSTAQYEPVIIPERAVLGAAVHALGGVSDLKREGDAQ
jgi:hypothetical protein